MTIETKRTCGTCCSYANGECMNGVSGLERQEDYCDDHETPEEFEKDVEALCRFRVSIGLPPRRTA